MGVSGSGKTTIAGGLALRLGWEFAEADAFHSAANIEKMSNGIALTDDDRWPWLDAIAAWIEAARAAGKHCVITCSALKRTYRQRISAGHDDVRFVYLHGTYDLVARRMTVRTGHYMPLALLRSQFETLEEPGTDEKPLIVSIEPPPGEIVDTIIATLGLAERSRSHPVSD